MHNQNNIEEKNDELIHLAHHQQQDLCRTRPAYRQGRQLTAVKSYSVISESSHLLIFGVPKINLRQELKSLLSKYGKVTSITLTSNYETEQFTECFHASFGKFHSAKFAKKHLDTKNFYGGSLHICYAPELESTHETRQKLHERRHFVRKKLMSMKYLNKKKENMKHSAQMQNYKNQYNQQQQPQYMTYVNPLKLNGDSSSQNVKYVDNDIISNTSKASVNQISVHQNDESKACSSKRTIECTDDKVYVFKKKKRKPKKNDLSINMYTNESKPTSSTYNLTPNIECDVPQSDTMGKIVVYENVEKPRVENISKKSVNKIILKINTKLI